MCSWCCGMCIRLNPGSSYGHNSENIFSWNLILDCLMRGCHVFTILGKNQTNWMDTAWKLCVFYACVWHNLLNIYCSEKCHRQYRHASICVSIRVCVYEALMLIICSFIRSLHSWIFASWIEYPETVSSYVWWIKFVKNTNKWTWVYECNVIT